MECRRDIQEIANLAGLPLDDPRRRHLDECPRCRGLAEAQALFLQPGDTDDLDALGTADALLQERLASALDQQPARSGRPRRRRLWLAAAAVLAVCAVGLAADDLLRRRLLAPPQVGERLRGDEQTDDLIVTSRGGALHLTWSSAPAADTYRFVFLDAASHEIGGRTVDPATGGQAACEISREDLPGAVRFYQVYAISYGDTVARSSIVPAPSGP